MLAKASTDAVDAIDSLGEALMEIIDVTGPLEQPSMEMIEITNLSERAQTIVAADPSVVAPIKMIETGSPSV